MGRIILMNIFFNYMVAMPLIIITIYNKWSFGRYFKSLIFFLFFLNILFWIIHLLYITFIVEPREREKARLEAIEKDRIEEEKRAKEQKQEKDVNVIADIPAGEEEFAALRELNEAENLEEVGKAPFQEDDIGERITDKEIKNSEEYMDLDTSQE